MGTKMEEFPIAIDALDRRLLEMLQEDASVTQSELATRLAVSQASCWRRLRLLERSGVLRKQVALVDPKAVGLGVSVVANVSLREHTDMERSAFESFVLARPEIVECYLIAGERDYLLRIVIQSVEAYERFLTTQLLKHPSVSSASSSFALKQIKYTTALPLQSHKEMHSLDHDG